MFKIEKLILPVGTLIFDSGAGLGDGAASVGFQLTVTGAVTEAFVTGSPATGRSDLSNAT
jgi:hypothetical protein